MTYRTPVFGYIYRFIAIILLCFIPNSILFFDWFDLWEWYFICIVVFLLLNIFPSVTKKDYPSFRWRMCSHGNELLIYFSVSAVVSLIYQTWFVITFSEQNNLPALLLSAGICALYENLLLIGGLIAVFFTSQQLGIKYRILTLIFFLIPVVRWFLVIRIIRIVNAEINFEIFRYQRNCQRINEKVCATKYPVLLVHGVFFRDSRYFNYWGRIPEELTKNGAKIYYGNHQSALSIKDSAEELAERIREIVRKENCGKLNIIAHSKGGLDCRYAISELGCEKYVATLTTINTPHRGCHFAEYLLTNLPQKVTDGIADKYNFALKKLGDKNPDFISAVSCLTAKYCEEFNNTVHDSSKVVYRSVGSKLNRATNGQFPLNFSYNLVKIFDGDNDGLVSETSFSFGEKYTYLTTKGKRGISHADVIDLNRENIKNFDVREFYVSMVSQLKQDGF